jgi:hypothetical protein
MPIFAIIVERVSDRTKTIYAEAGGIRVFGSIEEAYEHVARIFGQAQIDLRFYVTRIGETVEAA